MHLTRIEIIEKNILFYKRFLQQWAADLLMYVLIVLRYIFVYSYSNLSYIYFLTFPSILNEAKFSTAFSFMYASNLDHS